ncbi:branched-chain amino acid ABC transporter permease [Castellaniella sp.]|uniref:branched-chain amino acid ABC transporter permease n=2 Tax=Castellaniella sp. TaxID=1955812 RepID=UPI0035623073
MKPLMTALLAIALFFAPQLMGGSNVSYSLLVIIGIFAILAYSLDLVVSDLGEVSLGHTVFFGTGAYTTAVASSQFGLGALETLMLALAASTLVAAFVGLITLKLREFIFSLVTYSLAVISITLADNWMFVGGTDGISGIPPLKFSILGLDYLARTDQQLWPVVYLGLLATLYLVHTFRRSRLGSEAMTVQLNTGLAIMSGINPMLVRMKVLVLSAPLAGLAGWLYAYQRAYISSDVFGAYFLLIMLTAVIMIGRRQLLCPLIGVALIITQEKMFSLGAYWDNIILGTIIILVLCFFPGGLSRLFTRRVAHT